MLLERQFGEIINVKNLTIEAPEGAGFDMRREFEALKSSTFYDGRRKRWRWGLDNAQNPDRDRAYRASPELLALFINGQFQNEGIAEEYATLKRTPIHNAEKKMWYPQNPRMGVSMENHFYTQDQLLDILVELRLDRNLGHNKYEALMNNSNFRWQGYWYHQVLDRGFFGIAQPDGHTSHDQLIGIFVESFFDKEKAQERYDQLKGSDFHVRRGQYSFWCLYLEDTQRPDNVPVISSNNELMSILVHAQFDREQARVEYEALKKTKLFDHAKRQWIENVAIEDSTMKMRNLNRTSYVQLLDILVRNAIRQPNPQFETQTPSLPEARNF